MTETAPPAHGGRRSSSALKMAAQSQGIKQLMAAEKEAAQVVANARKSEFVLQSALLQNLKPPVSYPRREEPRKGIGVRRLRVCEPIPSLPPPLHCLQSHTVQCNHSCDPVFFSCRSYPLPKSL